MAFGDWLGGNSCTCQHRGNMPLVLCNLHYSENEYPSFVYESPSVQTCLLCVVRTLTIEPWWVCMYAWISISIKISWHNENSSTECWPSPKYNYNLICTKYCLVFLPIWSTLYTIASSRTVFAFPSKLCPGSKFALCASKEKTTNMTKSIVYIQKLNLTVHPFSLVLLLTATHASHWQHSSSLGPVELSVV